jgi:hypothetical protein
MGKWVNGLNVWVHVKRNGKKAVMTYFKVLSWNLCEQSKDSRSEPQSG